MPAYAVSIAPALGRGDIVPFETRLP